MNNNYNYLGVKIMQNKQIELSELFHKTEQDISEIANGAGIMLNILNRLEKHLTNTELASLQSKTENLDKQYASHSHNFYNIKKNNRPRAFEEIEKILHHLGQQTQTVIKEMHTLRNECIALGDRLDIDIGLYDLEEHNGEVYPVPSPSLRKE